MRWLTASLHLMAAAHALASPFHRRAEKTADATISANFDQCESAPPVPFGAGVTYGFNETRPDDECKCSNADQKQSVALIYMYVIPVIRPLALRYYATGGGRTASGGWATDQAGFSSRLNASIKDCQRAQTLGGNCLIKLSDLWGADGTQTTDLKYPGDTSDWTSWAAFLKASIEGLTASALQNISLQIWNEPDTQAYWPREASVFYEAFSRAADALHASSLKATAKVWGPSIDSAPTSDNTWLNGFFDFLKEKPAPNLPDVWDFHLKRDKNNDPLSNLQSFQDTIKQHLPSVTDYTIATSEYGTRAQQLPAFTSWFLSRFSQAGLPAIRSNWATGPDYHDYLTQLLVPPQFPGQEYSETGDYWTYKTYADISTSAYRRCNSSSAADNVLASYASCNGTGGGVLIGGPGVFTGTIDVQLNKISNCIRGIKAGQEISTQYWRLWGKQGEPIIGPVLIEGRGTAPDEQDSLTVPAEIHDVGEATFILFNLPGQ